VRLNKQPVHEQFRNQVVPVLRVGANPENAPVGRFVNYEVYRRESPGAGQRYHQISIVDCRLLR
jgi:hypothetical protein